MQVRHCIASLSLEMRTTTPELENSSKKRKLAEPRGDELVFFVKRSKAENTKSVFDTELHLKSPLPSEWQRFFYIQSGQIPLYDTRTNTRTSKDPRRSPEPPSPVGHMSLDLELNLPCDSVRKIDAMDQHHQFNKHNFVSPMRTGSVYKKINSSTGGLTPNLSWLAVEEEEQQEMVATVCMRCHMLVMLCKSLPACPNCKFMHP